ncbi:MULTISPECIES: DUF3108 domain-containing protein [Desulfococcus]|jgi:hypothetical protein|uniref:DUF3108 domain-containing protein n=1 Tax=Desulfococcus multivorans DSM 2059 TaxID=1121405 RepID=S7UXJ7_DESML|nr:DUF3108 domain-containing protein [Desulfococcus multivorans]AOY57866.1 conserved uncharacterized protein, DUF3108 [Desulfococcus multivorans]AQV00245.1 hypothetical protein B2D07_05305 [Desulfococcus multivorans]EPR38949.1 Protein of unknown function DUF3108 [Desulfococcus multivorans DSM 2059]MDX9817573.1 DUF3108 domain-containing protein [Desulfococcus multivorans]SJZ66603.1 Protein of unknown function [Desulfococcus multivorans DSM 2059]
MGILFRGAVVLVILIVVPLTAGAMPPDTAVGYDSAITETISFFPGERLSYALRWEFILAGEATLEVLPNDVVDDRPVRHFALTVRSNAVLDKIYKVRDRIDAYTDLRLSRSVLYRKKQKEGRRERDIVVRFDWENQTAVYTNSGRSKAPVALMPGTFDPLSAFYFVRASDLSPGRIIERPVSDGKKCVRGSAEVLERETIRVNGRTYETLRLEPELRHVGGVFEKSPDAKIELWVSADRRHIPVRIRSRVAVGRFVAELMSDSTETDSDWIQ